MTKSVCAKPLGDTRLSRVLVPSALAESGSDIPRDYLTRLRSVSRVSHPPDALLPPKPFRPISDGNAPGISPFEGFPFRVLGSVSRPTLPAWRWLERPRQLNGRCRLARLPGNTLRESPWPPSLQAAGVTRSSLELSPLQGCFSLSDGLARRECLLPWTLIRSAANRRPSPVLRSLDRRGPRNISEEMSAPPGVLPPRPGKPGVGGRTGH
jgi:hypothetical protein